MEVEAPRGFVHWPFESPVKALCPSRSVWVTHYGPPGSSDLSPGQTSQRSLLNASRIAARLYLSARIAEGAAPVKPCLKTPQPRSRCGTEGSAHLIAFTRFGDTLVRCRSITLSDQQSLWSRSLTRALLLSHCHGAAVACGSSPSGTALEVRVPQPCLVGRGCRSCHARPGPCGFHGIGA